MTDQRIKSPPAELLRLARGAPQAMTITAEIRSDASIPFDPDAAPAFLTVANAYGALALLRVDVPWTVAQDIQLWLIGPPGTGNPLPAGTIPAELTRENALSQFVANLQVGAPPAPFADLIGIFLEGDVSHARYTIVVGIKVPVNRQQYQAAWFSAINATRPAGGAPVAGSWFNDLGTFLKLMHNQSTTQEEYIQRAARVGSLTQTVPAPIAGDPPVPLYPMISLLFP